MKFENQSKPELFNEQANAFLARMLRIKSEPAQSETNKGVTDFTVEYPTSKIPPREVVNHMVVIYGKIHPIYIVYKHRRTKGERIESITVPGEMDSFASAYFPK